MVFVLSWKHKTRNKPSREFRYGVSLIHVRNFDLMMRMWADSSVDEDDDEDEYG